jgi:hypothetical protein
MHRGEWKNPVVLIANPKADDWKNLSQPLSKYTYFWIFEPVQVKVANLPPEWHINRQFSLEDNKLIQIVQ